MGRKTTKVGGECRAHKPGRPASCYCMGLKGHKGPHCCGCGFRWTYMGPDTAAVRLVVDLQVATAEGQRIVVKEAREAALEAVEEALHAAENRGFNHPYAETLCVGVAGVVLAKETR
ncbi:MAG: hypothetical protein ABFE07_28940 [Armatimonadia bacterium]